MYKAKTLVHLGLLTVASVLPSLALAATPVSAVAPAAVSAVPALDMTKPDTILEIIKTELKVGTGEEAVAGKDVVVHYTGWLYSTYKPEHKNLKFDSSLDRITPFTFRLGAGKVIKGWDQGIVGMKVGGKRNLIVPSALAYGERGMGRGMIPKGAVLVFDIELLDVKTPEPAKSVEAVPAK